MVFRLKIDLSVIVNEMLDRLPKSIWSSKMTRFLDPCMGGGQFIVEIERRLRAAGHGDDNIAERVFGVEKSQLFNDYAVNRHGLVGTFSVDKNDVPAILTDEDMKFDAIVGNPPYNSPKTLKKGSKKPGGGSTLWDRFVVQSFDRCQTGGHVCLVHPIGWRSFTGDYEKIAGIYMENNLVYLSMNDYAKGKKTFGAGTAYDVVVCQKTKYGKRTVVVDFDGNTSDRDLSKYSCIPSGKLDDIIPMLAVAGEDTCEVLYSSIAYESRKPFVSRDRSKKFKHPIVHSVNVDNVPTFLYSSLNNRLTPDGKNFFGVSKVIFARWSGTMLDLGGDYGCSQDTRAIVDTPNNLPKILKAIRSDKLINMMRYLNWGSGMPDTYNKDAFKLFRKDFWKKFA